jgi:hypothetical protein
MMSGLHPVTVFDYQDEKVNIAGLEEFLRRLRGAALDDNVPATSRVRSDTTEYLGSKP